jgi:hypothetical protein
MTDRHITVNRAPVLTLWAAVVAERLGHDTDAALTLGKALSGLMAQTKGRMIGVFEQPTGPQGEPPKRTGLGEEFWVPLCGRSVPAMHTEQGVRAVVLDKPIDPASVQAYLEKSFGEHLPAVREAMVALAAAYSPDALADAAYDLYARFRPVVASGKAGWGQKSVLDVGLIGRMAER